MSADAPHLLVKGLTVRAAATGAALVAGVDFALPRGRILGVVGESSEIQGARRWLGECGEYSAMKLDAAHGRQRILDRPSGQLVPERDSGPCGDEDARGPALVQRADGFTAYRPEQPGLDLRRCNGDRLDEGDGIRTEARCPRQHGVTHRRRDPLASRLESLGKQYGTSILVSATVEQDARAGFWFRHLDRVAVHGKRTGVEIYELLGRRPGDAPPAIVAPYERALAAYFARDFAAALAIFDTLADDPASRVLAARCRAFVTAPPSPDWDGVFVASAK